MIGPSYLTVHMWDKHFNPYEHEISSTVVWARLLDLPIHYFHQEAVMKIGRRMGKPIRIDAATRTKARSDYARVCVQVDLTKPLLSQFTIYGKKYFIQYEGLDKICLSCGTYTEIGACPCTQAQTPMEVDSSSAVNQSAAEEPQQEALYGDWMIAKRKPRQQNKEQPTRSQKGGGSQLKGKEPTRDSAPGSRFDVLQAEDLQETSVEHPAPGGDISQEKSTTYTHVKKKKCPRLILLGRRLPQCRIPHSRKHPHTAGYTTWRSCRKHQGELPIMCKQPWLERGKVLPLSHLPKYPRVARRCQLRDLARIEWEGDSMIMTWWRSLRTILEAPKAPIGLLTVKGGPNRR
ncbi:unnamed protein product [Linum tenue]|nr:unnamed protein product [Linum tenue]